LRFITDAEIMEPNRVGWRTRAIYGNLPVFDRQPSDLTIRPDPSGARQRGADGLYSYEVHWKEEPGRIRVIVKDRAQVPEARVLERAFAVVQQQEMDAALCQRKERARAYPPLNGPLEGNERIRPSRAPDDAFTSPAKLVTFLVPHLQAIQADANLLGSVQQRLAPLLRALPTTVALTVQAAERLRLEAHETAYLIFESWRLLSPGVLRPLGEQGNLAETLQQAAAQSATDPLRDVACLLQARDFVVGVPEETNTAAPSHGILSHWDRKGVGYVQLVTSSWADEAVRLHLNNDPWRGTLSFFEPATRSGDWQVVFSRGNPTKTPLRSAPPPVLLELRRLLMLFVPKPEHLDLSSRAARAAWAAKVPKEHSKALDVVLAIDKELARQETRNARQVQEALRAFAAPDADPAVGELSAASLRALASLATARASG
jgi:hypothetical protein